VREEQQALLAARALALYVLSLGAAASATLAWRAGPSSSLPRLVALAAGLAAAAAFGDGLSGRLLAILERRTLSRLRFAVGAAHACLGFGALLLVLGTADPRMLATAASLFTALQVAAVLLADVLGGHVTALSNAFVLTVLAALAGGTEAGVAVTAYLGAFVYFVTFDHFVRRLAAHPPMRADLLGVTVSQASALAAPLVLGMAAYFAAFPASPYTLVPLVLRRPATAPGEIEQAFARLAFLVLLGGAAVLGLRRALGGGAVPEPPSEEVVEPERGPEEALDASPRPRKDAYTGRRGRVVRAYVRFLAEAERRGFHRRPSQTPATIAEEIRGPARPLARLTELFMRARYGRDEPEEADAREAEAASRALVGAQTGKRR
jgi:hypothetical protein